MLKLKYPFKNYFNFYRILIIHKLYVFISLLKFSFKLIWRAVIHDASKFTKLESEQFIKYMDQLYTSQYGTERYNKLLIEMDPAIKNHYKNNSHHPEYYKNKIQGMNLLDLVEMFYDWETSTKKHKTGDIIKSIEINRKRFNISNDLCEILKNTAKKKT